MVSEATTTVRARLDAGTRVRLSARGHEWAGDEPADLGGGDAGPTPYELLLGSLGACTALTLRLYARHKGIELDSVEVEYAFARVHADDCEDCEKREGDDRIETVRSRVRLSGSFDEAQRKRLEQIVARCPVHKTLTGGVQIFDEVEFV